MRTIFQNPILELLTRTNIWLHVFWYTSLSVSLMILGTFYVKLSIFKIGMLFVSGFLLWSLIEYIMHRFVFHFITENSFVKRFHHIFHGIHHEDPRDEKRTLMPPLPGVLFVCVYLSIAWIALGSLSLYLISGLVIGYLCYSGLHYAIHVYRAPKRLEFLWTHHLLHHYQQPEKAFGVTTRLWDRIFGTMPIKKKR